MRILSILVLFTMGNAVDAQINFGLSQFESKAIMDFVYVEPITPSDPEEEPEEGPEMDQPDITYKGIILPIISVSSTTNAYTNGTFAVDKTDKKVKIYENGEWIPLTDEGSFEAIIDKDLGEEISTAVVLNTSDEVGGGVVIGTPNENGEIISEAQGVLVLEATDKALVLPRVPDPHLNIPSPVAGTMCYDTVSNSLAVFDGAVWSYWK